MIRWFAGIRGDPYGVRELTPEELETMNKAEKIFVKIDVEDRPAGIGEKMVNFGMECWHVSYDGEGGKIIYRKIEPSEYLKGEE